MANYIHFKYTDGKKTINVSTLDEGLVLLDTSNRKLYARNTSFGLPLITDKPNTITNARDKSTYTISINAYNNLVQEIIDNEEVCAIAFNDLNDRMTLAENDIENNEITIGTLDTSIKALYNTIYNSTYGNSALSTKVNTINSSLGYANLPALQGWFGHGKNYGTKLSSFPTGTNFLNYDTFYINVSSGCNLSIPAPAGTNSSANNHQWTEKTFIIANSSTGTINIGIPLTSQRHVLIITNPGHTISTTATTNNYIPVAPQSYAEINLIQMPMGGNSTSSSTGMTITNNMLTTAASISISNLYMNYPRVVFVRYTN